LDDAIGAIYSAFLVDEEDTMSRVAGVPEVVTTFGLFDSLYTDRGSHYWHTAKAGGTVDQDNPTQFRRTLNQLIDMIPATRRARGARRQLRRVPKQAAADPRRSASLPLRQGQGARARISRSDSRALSRTTLPGSVRYQRNGCKIKTKAAA